MPSTAIVQLQSASPYSQSRPYEVPKKPKELPKDYEERTWRERLHVDENDRVYIPPMALKNCLSDAAKYLSIQIPGKGKATYTKHFESGVLCVDGAILFDGGSAILGRNVAPEWKFLPSDGVRGSGKRVWKCFPVIQKWEATASYLIYDDTVTQDIFVRILREAGVLIGMGFFRPRNNGYYGRFQVVNIEWKTGEI